MKLGGKERHLRYTMAAVRKIEERFGVDFVNGKAIEGIRLEDFLWLILLGLEHEAPPPPTRWDRFLAAIGFRPLEEPLDLATMEAMVDMDELEELGESMERALGSKRGGLGNSPPAR